MADSVETLVEVMSSNGPASRHGVPSSRTLCGSVLLKKAKPHMRRAATNVPRIGRFRLWLCTTGLADQAESTSQPVIHTT
jgi:hypothetical protein